MDVVTSDEHRLGQVVAERGDYVVVESGHVFKSRHAIPTDFLHEYDGVLRATVAKAVVVASPKIEEEQVDLDALRLHYGLIEDAQPGADGAPAIPESEGLHEGTADSSTFGGHPRTTEAPDPRRDWVDDDPERRRA